MDLKLPRTITLPFGYVVKVKLASAKECAEMETPDTPTMYGWWEADTQTIYIRKTLPPKKRRYILGHEMHHALLDWMHHCLDHSIMESTKA